MKAESVIVILGYFFLVLSLIWPANRWGGPLLRVVFSAISFGLFLANIINIALK